MDNQEVIEAIKQICEEKNISYQSVIETIEAALAVAYRKDYGFRGQHIEVNYHPETGEMEIFLLKKVVEKPEDEPEAATETPDGVEIDQAKLKEREEAFAEMVAEEKKKLKDAVKKHLVDLVKHEPEEEGSKAEEAPVEKKEGEEPEEVKKRRFSPRSEILIEDATKIDSSAELEDFIRVRMDLPTEYGRMAAQTAKQVIIQKLREAEREAVFAEFKDKQGEVLTGTIHRVEGRMVFVDLGHAIGVLPPPEQIPKEHYQPNQKLKVFVMGVNATNKGPEIVVSRGHPDMVRHLFQNEVPEIASGAIEIKAIAREAGSRTKIAVRSVEENIDPIGSCVGQRGTRVQTIINEIGGEKIDIVEYEEDPVRFIIHALAPAKVLTVKLNESDRSAAAEVKEDQLSLAIGRSGQNVRLAARLTGWKIDILKEGEELKPKPSDEISLASLEQKTVKTEEGKGAGPKAPEALGEPSVEEVEKEVGEAFEPKVETGATDKPAKDSE